MGNLVSTGNELLNTCSFEVKKDNLKPMVCQTQEAKVTMM